MKTNKTPQLKHILASALRKVKPVNEAMDPPYELYGRLFYEELTHYTYDAFDEHHILKKFDHIFSDIEFTKDVLTVDLKPDPKKSKKFIILFNPDFASVLLQCACDNQEEPWDFDEDNDKYCYEYLDYYLAALLWVSALGMVKLTTDSNDNPYNNILNKAKAYRIATQEAIDSFSGYEDKLRRVTNLLDEFTPRIK